ncbi:hypothetical protein PIGHUM_01553 [Pigmentiphaga humi]|uniref:ABC-type transport auxiliary lipoprotein component domain-containing protein n=1 Tax=Pigmentiphaga humi TaxID=2478468 RepID=A0A3P4B1C4_9BURK|nr:ABC-type transport auxiliary lipoprotein family protein [Pigmentiphaga humi]VCU69490.1 hypothetical protein PIGHUM_01553 [Pigmentiphaga humi]
MKTPRARLAALCAAAGLLAGCSLLPEQQTVEIYRLPSALKAPAASSADAQEWSLRIDTPHASPVLEATRIAVLASGDQVSSYAGARWAAPPPALVRARLAQAFRADGRAASVSTDESNIRTDLELDSDLRAFQSEYRNGAPHAVLVLDARLVAASTRRVVASRSFEVARPAEGVQVQQVVSAFGAASDELAAQVVQWVMDLHPARAYARR